MMKTLKTHIKNLKTGKGFTLVELLVVIAIIAILSVSAYVALGGQTGKSRDARRMQDIGSIQTALELYYVDNNSSYPATLDELVSSNKMPKLPVDPASSANYNYKRSVSQKQYQIGATMEGEDGSYKAYVIGNSETDLLDGVVPPEGGDCSDPVADQSTICVPMDIWNL